MLIIYLVYFRNLHIRLGIILSYFNLNMAIISSNNVIKLRFYMFYIANLYFSIYVKKILFFTCRNSLSISLLQNLIEEIKKAGNDVSLKSIVLCGNGPVFSAGHNLNELVS